MIIDSLRIWTLIFDSIKSPRCNSDRFLCLLRYNDFIYCLQFTIGGLLELLLSHIPQPLPSPLLPKIVNTIEIVTTNINITLETEILTLSSETDSIEDTNKNNGIIDSYEDSIILKK